MNELENAASLMGKKGGKKTLKNKGKKHFSEMGRKSGLRRKALKLAKENEKLSTSVEISIPLDEQAIVC